MNLQILVWIFIAIFSLTAIITLLGITGVIKSIKDKYLNALFTALIIEVIGAVLGVFKGIDIENMQKIPEKIFEKTNLAETGDLHEDTQIIIEAINNSVKVDSLLFEIEKGQQALEDCKGNLSALDKDFYSYIIKLRNAMSQYPERSVNIFYQPDLKVKEYELLKQIFIILEEFENPNQVTDNEILEEWIAFKTRHGRAEQNKYHILEYDITLLVRDFLNKFYALESSRDSTM
ncbi:MAG: hypothetical protein PF517_16940 [Salinivirgaceae bacterium]|jgi:hypothetical protein|nr:hypothetical protein [Salinivirgaceae bacterium]